MHAIRLVMTLVALLAGCSDKGDDSGYVVVGGSSSSSSGSDGSDGGAGSDGGDGGDGSDDSDGGEGTDGGGGSEGGGSGDGSDGGEVEACVPTGNVWEGRYYIETTAELERLCDGSIDSIEGDLSINRLALTGPIEIDCLTKVCGDLSILQSEVASVSFPGLDEIGGDVVVQRNDNLTTIDLSDVEVVHGEIGISDGARSLLMPRLRSAVSLSATGTGLAELDVGSLEELEGRLYFSFSDIEELSLPRLRTIGEELTVYEERDLASFSAPVLEYAGDIHFRQVRKLQHLSMPALRTAGHLKLSENRDLVTASFPVLRECSKEVLVTNHELLESVDLRALETVGGEAGFCWNDELTDIDVDDLRIVADRLAICEHRNLDSVRTFQGVTSVGGDLLITNNDRLSTSAAEALRDAIGEGNIGGDIEIEGNGG